MQYDLFITKQIPVGKTMKRILLIPVLLVTVALGLSGCGKEYIDPREFDEDYWLRQERGVVAYTDFYCNLYIVETYRGYTVVESNGSIPYVGDVVYGNFSSWGYRNFYNRSAGYLISGNVHEYWLSYFSARDYIEYNCGGFGGKTNADSLSAGKQPQPAPGK